ncbi:MAG: hypothetical protein ACRDTG_22720 [Pseudonocardiaceae bacterium]
MYAVRLPTPSQARSSLESVTVKSEPTGPAHRAERLAARDHRDDGSAIGGLVIMLAVALPLWVMMIILIGSLVW